MQLVVYKSMASRVTVARELVPRRLHACEAQKLSTPDMECDGVKALDAMSRVECSSEQQLEPPHLLSKDPIAEGTLQVHGAFPVQAGQKASTKRRRPVQCRLCPATFTQVYGLTRHERTHTGKQPFRCDQYSASFARKDHLNLHMCNHATVKAFKCHMCSKAFLRSDLLRRHVSVRHQRHPG
ncbi:uncharacterized protein LOC144107994 isoform X3 [Amblyomma americanum]